MKQERRGSWYILTALVLGAAFGLVYSWVVSPVKYVDAPPSALRADYKDDYRALVAAAFLYSNDLERAQARLDQLKDDETAQGMALQAQRALAEGRPQEEVRALSMLALALSQGVTPASPGNSTKQSATPAPVGSEFTSTPLFVEPTLTPSETLEATLFPLVMIRTSEPSTTPGPSPTATSTPTQGAPFVLQETRLVCNTDQPQPLIQVEVRDAAGQPVPSVELVVTWDGGQDHFFTGLQPELGLGYGDFLMLPDVVYSIRLTDGGQAVNDLTAAQCVSEDENRYWGSWYLIFFQPG